MKKGRGRSWKEYELFGSRTVILNPSSLSTKTLSSGVNHNADDSGFQVLTTRTPLVNTSVGASEL